jgi:hypothetical protein
MNAIDRYYESLTEPNYSCLFALREWFLEHPAKFTEEWKYQLPFFYYEKKPFCYFHKDKKTQKPYIGFHRGFLIEHYALVKGDRTRIKILPIPPKEDLPIEVMQEITDLLLPYY